MKKTWTFNELLSINFDLTQLPQYQTNWKGKILGEVIASCPQCHPLIAVSC